MGKTRDLFKKIRDTKGIFHAKMGSIKDRNGMDLREAEDIKKRWQEYTEELCKNDIHDSDSKESACSAGDGHIFHAKMGTIKDRNGMDLTEAEDIQKRWQEYTEELYKKNIFMTQIITMV